MKLRLFTAVDGAAHLLNRAGLLPDRVTGWLCDRFDLWLGVTPDELDRTNSAAVALAQRGRRQASVRTLSPATVVAPRPWRYRTHLLVRLV